MIPVSTRMIYSLEQHQEISRGVEIITKFGVRRGVLEALGVLEELGATLELSAFMEAKIWSLSGSLVGIKLINFRKDLGDGLLLSIESTVGFLTLLMILVSFFRRGVVAGLAGVDGTNHVLRRIDDFSEERPDCFLLVTDGISSLASEFCYIHTHTQVYKHKF